MIANKQAERVGQEDTPVTSLRFLLLGDVGVGKSSFIDTFISTLANIHSNETLEEFIPKPATATSYLSSSVSLSPPAICLPVIQVRTAHTLQHKTEAARPGEGLTHDPLGLLPPKIEIPSREVRFVTLPGYSSTTNPSSILSMTDDYLNHHLQTATSIFAPSISSSQLAWFLIAGSGAHSLPTCAFYFVLYELKPIDILYMKLFHERVNLVPIITKSDTLSEKELWILKKRMVRQLKLNGIIFHTFGKDLATVEKMIEQRQWGAAPFVVSTRRDADGNLLKSELEALVKSCLYERFRYSQEEAAHKVITWRKAFGPSRFSFITTPEKFWGTQGLLNASNASNASSASNASNMETPSAAKPKPSAPFPEPARNSHCIVESDVGYTPSPQTPTPTPAPSLPSPPLVQNHVLDANNFATGFHASVSTACTSPTSPTFAPGNGMLAYLSPSSSAASPTMTYVPSTTYTSPVLKSMEENAAAQARLSLIQQSTGMVVDSSTRPNVIMDDKSKNTVHAPTSETSYMGSYMLPPSAADGSEVKVEIPFTAASYQPTTSDKGADSTVHRTFQQTQIQHTSFIQPISYPGAFLIAPSALSPTSPNEITPGIWEAVEMGDVATIQRHLNNGASPDQRNSSQSTLLHRAAWQLTKPYTVMHLLISHGANVNLTNANGNSVMQNVLMKHDDPALIKLLLDNGAESTTLNNENMNTLVVAALFNRIESAKYLLENDLASSEPETIHNAMQRAQSADKKAMQALLKSWQGKKGEKKRAELKERLRIANGTGTGTGAGGSSKPHHTQSPNHSQSQLNLHQRTFSQHHNGDQVYISDGPSVESFDTSKGGDGNEGSSKASSLHQEGTEIGSSAGASSSTSSIPGSTQSKNTARFNLKTMRAAAPSMSNLFTRK